MPLPFDPNACADGDAGIFGLPYSREESTLIYLPVPWEATTSYGGGTSKGPEAIREASSQLDLWDSDVEKPYEPGLHMLGISKTVKAWNKEAKAAAQKVIAAGGRVEKNKPLAAALRRVNDLSAKVNAWVEKEAGIQIKDGKILALIGGDHSTPYGAFRAAAAKHPAFGILHFDAHSDTRKAYEGFVHSHASIMYNTLENIPAVKKLVQVGIRDYCEEEYDYIQSQGERMSVFFDADLAQRKFKGENWDKIAQEIVAKLPKDVWVSFDIDGLDPRFCPHTGTPVPGGLDFSEAVHVLRVLAKSGRRIIGFDLNEVAPGKDEWDANVGARMLYKLSALTLASQGKARLR